MRRLKTIDELYEEVKDFGLVITNDIALETALNNRIDTVRIGRLAITPRHIAQELGESILGKPFLTDLELISAVASETGLGFKQVYSEILNFREIRRHTRDVRQYAGTPDSRKIYDSYSRMPTLEAAMDRFDPEDPSVSDFFDRRDGIAVIGLEGSTGVGMYDDLDKRCLPLDFSDISIYADGEFSIDRMYEVGNDRQLAENAADLVDPEHAEDYAIVISANSPIADSVRSALYRRKLPFVNTLNVRDLAQIRDFVSFVSLALNYRTNRVKAVKELFANYNGFFEPGREQYLLRRQGPEDMKEHALTLKETMRRIAEDGMTFAEVKDAICDRRARPQVKMLIEELGISDEKVTPLRVSELRFAVENIQELKHNEQLPEDEKTGVLIADCKNSVFVDRPVVIYLGMEQEWNIPVVGRRYIDPEDESERNACRLEAILQQGQRRVYCVNSSKNGKEARPCLSFDLITGKACSHFSDICGEVVQGRWAAEKEPLDMDVGEIGDDSQQEFEKQFSKSSFNKYMSCPRRYMFNSLLTTPDQTYTEFGTLIHEFAELYACYPEVVREKGVDSFATMVFDRYAGLSTPLMEELDSVRIRMAMTNVMRFIDTLDVHAPLNTPVSTRSEPNRFMEALGLEMTSDVCETDHRSASHPMHGVFDLYWNGDITDYKTGKDKDISKLFSDMDFVNISQNPEFQPLIYLALATEENASNLRFKQFYAMGRDVESSSPDFDISENMRTIEVVPGDLFSFMENEDVFLPLFENAVADKTKRHIRSIVRIVIESGIEESSEWTDNAELIAEICSATGLKADAARKALSKLSGIVKGGMIRSGNTLKVPMQTLRRFLDVLDRAHEQVMESYGTTFPASPCEAMDCGKCDYFQVCTGCIITVEEGEYDE